MKYTSTRSKIKTVESAEMILQGLASDGGLFVMEKIPKVSLEEIDELKKIRYEQRAAWLFKLFFTDYTDEEIGLCTELAYNWFDARSRVPVSFLARGRDEISGLVGSMELWHGPTNAFKDIALQALPYLMNMALKKVGENRKLLILAATSGDTGTAALAGFANMPQIKVMIFYPEDGVSDIQKLQMTTQIGKNLNVIGIKGNFDDAQAMVKKIFIDKKIREELDKLGVRLNSANSINLGRIIPQIVYYFSSYAEFLRTKRFELGSKVNVSVPTGNFGNILAAYYAMKMGLPINKLICASNINDVLTEFFVTGIYNRHRKFFKTITPSMDILVSSNLERLLYHESGGDIKQVKRYMMELNTFGKYKIDKKLKERLDKIFHAERVSEDETRSYIKQIFSSFKYVVDPHTAIGLSALSKYRGKTKDLTPVMLASTASPYKFSNTILSALGESVENLDAFAQIDKLNRLTSLRIPRDLLKLSHKKILHNDTCDIEEIPERVLKFAAE